MEKKGKLDTSAFVGIIEETVKKFPNIKCVCTTLREVHSTNRHSWSAVAWINGETFFAPQCELDVLDRVGGGVAVPFFAVTASIWPVRRSIISSTGA